VKKQPSSLPGDKELAELAARLGATKPLWDTLVAHAEATYPPVTREWKSAAKTVGWYLRLVRKKRTILYLLPNDGFFLTAFVFGEKATAAVHASDVPPVVKTTLAEARAYAEGRGIRLETKTAADLATMKTLAAIKMSH
jgi:hypothetical protein